MYLFDSNVFIEAMNRYYEASICPGFWNWIDVEHHNENIASIIPVYDEIKSDTRFKEIMPSIKDMFLLVTDSETVSIYTDIVNFVNKNPNYGIVNKNKFFSGADPWMIAKAKSINAILVTHEQPVQTNSKCNEFKVNYCNTFEMLKNLKAKFILHT